ncbi:metallophosphoesterase family protein [Paramicrobacterium agarici]|uniref:metallophosphoesterase family protein n=1 Tax=Paramicrobacterium agarici TaxID=630514 RepID=UPI00117172F1|nr:metallophosphoesterase [Microbacterium agarici]TQO23111.1 3',5'-cyclic AMP phosphodiesterase CpdA [Microbacterium agarici]
MTESRSLDERPVRVLHVSDSHLYGDDSLHYGIVDTHAALVRTLERAETIEGVDVVVLSGDLSDDMTVRSYERLRDLVGPWAARHDAEVVCAMGNHDSAAEFEQVLGPRTRAVDVRGVRVITLDSAVPHAGYGHVGDEQLRMLRDALATASGPSLVVVHHPPTTAYGPLLAALELQNAREVLDVCAAGGATAVLSGHYHHSLVAHERGIPVIVAPGVANTSDACPPAGHERSTIGSGFAIVDVPAKGEPTTTFFTAPSEQDGTEIFNLDADEVAQIARVAGVPA